MIIGKQIFIISLIQLIYLRSLNSYHLFQFKLSDKTISSIGKLWRNFANFSSFFREIVREELTNKQVIIRLLKLPSLIMPSNIWKRPVCKTTLLFSPAAYPAISYCEMHLP